RELQRPRRNPRDGGLRRGHQRKARPPGPVGRTIELLNRASQVRAHARELCSGSPVPDSVIITHMIVRKRLAMMLLVSAAAGLVLRGATTDAQCVDLLQHALDAK